MESLFDQLKRAVTPFRAPATKSAMAMDSISDRMADAAAASYIASIAEDAEFKEEDHPRNSKGGTGGGRFRTSGATIEKEDMKEAKAPFTIKFPRHRIAETDDPDVILKALKEAEQAAKGDIGPRDNHIAVTPRSPGGFGHPAWLDTMPPREAHWEAIKAAIRNPSSSEEVLKYLIGEGKSITILDDIERQMKRGGYDNVSNDRVEELLRAPFKHIHDDQ